MINKIIEKLEDLGVEAGLKLVYAIVIFYVGHKLIKLFIKLLSKDKHVKKIDKGVSTFLTSFTKVILYTVLFITIASVLGVPLTSIITLLGSAGLAIGLSLQGGLSNIAGGIIILFFKPFDVGDYIDNHTDSGTVTNISLFYTTLKTADNKIISIPNGSLANNNVVNYSKEPLRRLDINIGVSYNNSSKEVKKVINDILNKEKRIIDKEKTFVGITDYLDSSVTYTIRIWVNNGDYWNTKFDILDQLKVEFEKNNISIPYPQLDVHIEK